MEREIQKLFEGAVMKGKDFYIPYLVSATKLDYKTCVALFDIYKNETDTGYTLDEMLDPEFYTFPRMIELYNNGFQEIIPAKFYENEVFLKTIEMPEYPAGLFKGNTSIKTFKVPKYIRKIDAETFAECENLESVIIEDRQDDFIIGKSAFQDCRRLKTVVLPSKVAVRENAFTCCFRLSDINIKNIESFENLAFMECISLKEVQINEAVKTLPQCVFFGCIELENIDLANVEIIEEEAFRKCVKLDNVDLSKVTGIRPGAFASTMMVKNHRNEIKEKVIRE